MSEKKSIQRFSVIPGGTEEIPEPHGKPIEGIEQTKVSDVLADLDPEKVKAFDGVIKGLFKTLQSDEEPKMFQCAHCGGFHSFEINCSVCGSTNKAQQAFVTDRIDKMFTMAMCKKCLAVSIAIFQCRGIDPEMVELQKEYIENAKAQKESNE